MGGSASRETGTLKAEKSEHQVEIMAELCSS